MRRFADEVKKNKRVTGFCVMILLVFSISMLISYGQNWRRAISSPWNVMTVENTKTSGLGEREPFTLNDNEEIYQDVSMVSEKITGVSIKLVDIEEEKQGYLTVRLTDDKEKLIQKWNLKLSDFVGSGFCDFYLDSELSTKIGDVYRISVMAHGIGRETVGLELTQASRMNSNVYLENGEEQSYCFSYRLMNGGCRSLKYLFAAFSITAVGLILLVGFMLIKKKKIESIFAVMAVLIGGIYLFAIPPFAVPDEASHIATAYSESSKLLGKEAVNEEGKIIAEPDMSFYLIRQEVPTKDSYVRFMKGALGKTEDASVSEEALRKPLSTSHPGYVPQVLGITAGRLLHMGGEQLLLLGRLFALLWYAFIMYWAIRKIPFGKMVLFCIGMFPMTLQQIVSFNYDSILLGVSFFCFAYLLYLAYDKEKEKIQGKDIVIVVAATAAIASIKFVYLPLLGVGFLIPKEKFGGIRYKCMAIIGTGGIGVLTILATKLSVVAGTIGAGSGTAAGDTAALAYYSLSYCISHPMEVITILWQTVIKNLSFYIESMIATPLGWLEIKVPEIVVAVFLVLLLLSVLQQENQYGIRTTGTKACLGILGFVMSVLVVAALLIDFTYIGAETVLGVQGRYFLPALPLFMLMLQNKYIVLKVNLDNYIILGILSTQLYTILSITTTVVSR